ncbi:MAG TPA: hypothetical protein VIY86_10690, partial [Pirellulaceae bacterium]
DSALREYQEFDATTNLWRPVPFAFLMDQTRGQALEALANGPPQRRLLVEVGSRRTLFRVQSFTPINAVAGNPNPVSMWVQLATLNTGCGTGPAADLSPVIRPGDRLRFYVEPEKPRFLPSDRIELPVGTYIDLSWSGVGDMENSVTCRRRARRPQPRSSSCSDPMVGSN